jgi:hypothetical protein
LSRAQSDVLNSDKVESSEVVMRWEDEGKWTEVMEPATSQLMDPT